MLPNCWLYSFSTRDSCPKELRKPKLFFVPSILVKISKFTKNSSGVLFSLKMWVQKKPKGMNLYCTLYLRLFELFVMYNAMHLLINVTTALTTNVEIGLQFEKKNSITFIVGKQVSGHVLVLSKWKLAFWYDICQKMLGHPVTVGRGSKSNNEIKKVAKAKCKGASLKVKSWKIKFSTHLFTYLTSKIGGKGTNKNSINGNSKEGIKDANAFP